jgi:hypothetical protein
MQRHFFMKHTKFILTVFSTFLMAYALFSFGVYYFVILGLQERLLSQRKHDILQVADKLSAAVTDSSFLMADSLERLYSDPLEERFKVKRISVLDDKGRILARTQENSGCLEQSPDAAQLLKSGQSGFYVVEGERQLPIHLLRTFSFRSRVAGGVETVFDVEDIRSHVRSVLYSLLGLLAGVFLAGFLAYLYSALKTRSAFNELKRALLILEGGRFAFELRGDWRGEFLEFFSHFNRALESLKEREEKREALFERTKQIASLPRQSDLFEALTEALKTEASVDQLIVMLIKDNTLVVSHVSGYEESLVLRNEVYRTQEDVFMEIMDYGKPLALEDALEIRQNVRYRAVLKASGLTVLFPMTLGNEIFGLIHASRSREKGPYKAAEMDAGAMLSGGAAIGLMRLTGGLEGRFSAKEIAKAEVREFKGGSGIEVRALFLMGGGWVEFFELAGDKKEDQQILCFHGTDPEIRDQIRNRVTGMLDVVRKFRATLGNLSYFALSVLRTMPVSEERERYIKQFMENPFTPEGLTALFKGLLAGKDPKVGIEILKLNIKKKSYLSTFRDLRPFLIPEGIQAAMTESKGPFKPGDTLVAAPENLLSVRDFEVLRTEKAGDKLIAFLQPKFDSLKARAEDDAQPIPAVIIVKY